MTEKRKRLLLFDIDGTLIHSGGAGVEALKRALKERFGIEDDLHDIEFAGISHYGVWHYFEFGAVADDHHDRNELGAFARARAKEKHGREFSSDEIDVIGDTPRDIACGRALGARTIAVATGSWSREKLAEHGP